MKFEEFGINPQLVEAVNYMGFSEATAIQEKAIPIILEGRDLMGCAQTGTGKTAAYILPVLDFLAQKSSPETNTLILVPTRELAIQIDQQIQGFSYTLNISSIAIYGGGDGSDWGQQKTALTQGADIIVATPGKLISHLAQGYVKFDKIEHLILDEADRMLDIGFYDDIMKIISYLPAKRQNLMFSATMPPEIKSFARQILNDPAEIALELSKPAEGVLQAVYLIPENLKIDLIQKLIAGKPDFQSILIFTSTKKKVNVIVRGLRSSIRQTEGISSDLPQNEREEVLLRFKSRETRVLVATDVLSRGIDIKDINLIINFDVPGDAEDYVHRVGRTARADSTGVAITLVTLQDMQRLKRIEALIGAQIYRIPLPDDIQSTSPEAKRFPKKKNRFRKKGHSPATRENKGTGKPYADKTGIRHSGR